MSIETGLVAYLVAGADVAALVGARIYPLVIPQDAQLPAVAYQRISGVPDYVQTGASGLATGRFQFTCEASSYDVAKRVAAAIRSRLSGASGTMGTYTVQAVFVENDRDGWSSTFQAPVVRLDVMVWYQE